MFKQFTVVLVSVLVFAGHGTSYAMKAEEFYVAIRNHYGAQIEVHYNSQGKELTKVINPNKHFVLGLANNFNGEIKIYRAGAFVGHLAAGYSMQVNGLGQIWAQQPRRHDENTLLLSVTSAPGRLVVGYSAMQKNTLDNLGLADKFKGGVIDQFPGLEKHGLEKVLTPDQILAIRTPNEVVVPAGWVARATTGEDIARYILELPIGYNEDSVKKAFTALSLQWHPDKQKSEGMKEFATQVFRLITHAKDLLMQAVREKGHKQ